MSMTTLEISPDRLNDNPYQPRQDYGPLAKLAQSIEEDGVLEPPTVRIVMGGDPQKVDGISAAALPDEAEIQIADGHRRVRAIRKAGLDTVTVRVRHLSDEQMARLAAITAGHRESLTAIEQARHARVLKQQFEYTNKEVADTFGRSRSWVSNRLRLLKLPERLHANIQDGDLSARQAQAMMPIFEADLSDVTFPEGNRFAPDAIIEKALDGRSSDDLRRDVKQFESWVRQLKGETQKEVREQQYEKDLESTTDTNEDRRSGEQDLRSDDGDDSNVPQGQDSGGSDRGRGEALSELDEDVPRDKAGPDGGERGAATGPPDRDGVDDDVPTEPSGDGAPAEAMEGDSGHDIGDRYGDIEMAMASCEDAGFSWHLGTKAQGGYYAHVTDHDDEVHEVEGGDTAAGALFDAYMAAKEDTDPIGPVDPDTVDQILSADGIDMWDESVAAEASIPSLLVAHRVAGARQETWRTRLIAEAVQEREGTVTEEDIPDEVMAEVEAEVERRLETHAA